MYHQKTKMHATNPWSPSYDLLTPLAKPKWLRTLIFVPTDSFSSGKEAGIPNYGRPEGDLTDERLAHILNEASQYSQHMKQNPDDSHSNDSKSPHGCSSPFSRDHSQNRRMKKYENDDIPQEKVVRIYQEELVKLMGRRMEDLRNPAGNFPG